MNVILAILGKLSASLTLPLTFALVIIFVLRKLGKNYAKEHPVNVLNRKLRRLHKPMGITLAVVSVIHGISTQTAAFWGTLCTITVLLLGLNFMFRRKFKKPHWLNVHRALTVLMLLTLFLHLNEVEGDRYEHEEDFRGSIPLTEIWSGGSPSPSFTFSISSEIL